MKKFISHKDLTLAAGILVALLIVFTLWTSRQNEEFSGSKSNWKVNTSISKNLFQTGFSLTLPWIKKEFNKIKRF